VTGPTGSARRPRGSPPSPEQTPPTSKDPRRTVTESSYLRKASSSVMADQVRITLACPWDAVALAQERRRPFGPGERSPPEMSLVDPPAPQNFAANTLRRNPFGAAQEPKSVATLARRHQSRRANVCRCIPCTERSSIDLHFVEGYAWLAFWAPCDVTRICSMSSPAVRSPQTGRSNVLVHDLENISSENVSRYRVPERLARDIWGVVRGDGQRPA
jgi:hypothetical protein